MTCGIGSGRDVYQFVGHGRIEFDADYLGTVVIIILFVRWVLWMHGWSMLIFGILFCIYSMIRGVVIVWNGIAAQDVVHEPIVDAVHVDAQEIKVVRQHHVGSVFG